jgi:hypothetical protein
MNFEKGNIGVKDGTAIHRQGLYKLNSSEACANFVRCLMTSGFSKTSFSTAKNLNCLNLENE